MKVTGTVRTQVLLTRGTRTANEWHRVLGHPGLDKLVKLTKDEQLGIKVAGILEACEECPAGKGHHVEHPTRAGQTAKEVGERVHIDLGFLNNKEKASYDYYLLCKDEFSSYCFIYFMETKAQVNQALMELIAHFEYGSGKPIRCIISDNGSEFRNRANELLFMKERIVRETSSPYIAQQNGRIEREMQTINNMARTMLCQTQIEGVTSLLAQEALRTTCYLKNRLPTAQSDITPYERFLGRKPYLLNLVEFGSQVQVIDNGHQKSKLDPRTENGFVVGFTSRRNTYRVYVPTYRRVVETCDVLFNQHLSPKRLTKIEPEKGEAWISLDEIRAFN